MTDTRENTGDNGAKMRIRILEAGPYAVSGGVPLDQLEIETDADGNSVGWKKRKGYGEPAKTYSLCRCGRSKNKPYCDGTHAHCSWNPEEKKDRLPYLEAATLYSSRDGRLKLYDREELCVVARFCDVGRSIWNYVTESDDEHPEYAELAEAEAGLCPSGRFRLEKDGKQVEPDYPDGISLIEDPANEVRGPLFVHGDITLTGADGQEYERQKRYTLCRCGESRNMPFCDRSHFKCEHMQGLDE
jgi:CDGSH-type Zn-finger protein